MSLVTRLTCKIEHDHVVMCEHSFISDFGQIIETGPDTAHKLSVDTTLIGPISLGGLSKFASANSRDVHHIFVLRQLRATRRYWKWVVWNHPKGQAETRWGREFSFGMSFYSLSTHHRS
jgi:hypothetical protein